MRSDTSSVRSDPNKGELLQELESLRARVAELEGICIEHDRSRQKLRALSRLREDLLRPGGLTEKLKRVTSAVVQIFDADFCRIWITHPGDLCESGCVHAEVSEGPHVCRLRSFCLHLVASSGRYTHTDGRIHRRVPFGCYKIGRVAADLEPKFITNDVTNDSRVHDREWAKELGLVSFAGYRLQSAQGMPIGVLALFCNHTIETNEDALLEDVANTAAHVIQANGGPQMAD